MMKRNDGQLPGFAVRHPDLVTFLEQSAASPDEQVANQRGRRTPLQSRAIETHVLTELQLNPSHQLLDIGCGTGLVTRSYAGHIARVVAMDVSSGLVRRARANLATHPNVVVIQADAVRLPFADRSFDQILFCDVIAYFSRAELTAALREMKRVCRPGGSILVCGIADTRRELRTIFIYGGRTAPIMLVEYVGRRVRGRTRRGWYHPRDLAGIARTIGLAPQFIRQPRALGRSSNWRYDCRLTVLDDAAPAGDRPTERGS
jgi:SAM-dependent methyltransferase